MREFNLLVVPGSPVLVRELAPQDESGRKITDALHELVAGDDRPVEIVGSRDERWRTEITGSFCAWGADVQVGGGNYLPELVARYVLREREIADSRDRIAPLNPDALTVVVVDGPAGLTARAPLALIDGAPSAHTALEQFLDGAGGLPGELPGVVEKRLWLELAQLEAQKTLVASDSELGVGRYLAAWEVAA